MFSRVTKVFLSATALIGLVHAQDNCGNGPWNPANIESVGGNGGTRFCASKHPDGVIITGVEIWSSNVNVEQIQFSYSDNSVSPLFGKIHTADRHGKLNWDPSTVQVNQLNLWGNGNGRYLGRIQLGLTNGQSIDIGKDTNGQQVYAANVESGIIVGACGAQSDRIDSFAFLFLKSKVQRVEISNITFDDSIADLNSKKQGIQTVTLDDANHTNDQSNSTETYTFTRSTTETVSKTFTDTLTNTFGVTVSIALHEDLVAFKADYSTSLSYTLSDAQSTALMTSNAVQLTYAIATPVLPGQTIYCRATAQTGNYKGGYNSQVNVYLADGSVYSFAERGTYNEIAWSQAASSCQDKSFDAAPPHAKRAVKFLA